ncbi:hypothetical protein SLS56_006141 [Neofusicoccum ribis]|uniref:Rhodopsin domain-containing protein n=1 Tax=Neofusicoccum ribis TaxID=45134 RepID=A0ABR3SRM6_9PEZI
MTSAHRIQAAFIAIDWTGMTLALIPIVLRFWLRRRQLQPQPFTRNLSDALVVLSWLSGMVLICINTWKNSLRYHYRNHPASELYYSVPRSQSAHLLYVSWISLFFIYISLWSAKFALLAFYASLLRLQGRWARTMLWSATAFSALTFALHIALLTRWCSPMSANWDTRPGKLCSAVHDINSVTISTVANISTDLVILALPLFALASLRRERAGSVLGGRISGRMGKAELSGLAFVLLMAGLSVSAALARFVTLELVQSVPKANITHTIDVWALVEIVASLLAVCLPSLRAFVRRTREVAASKRGSKDSRELRSGGLSSGASGKSGSVGEDLGEGMGVVLDLSLLEDGWQERTLSAVNSQQNVSGEERRNDGFLAVNALEPAHTSSERLL